MAQNYRSAENIVTLSLLASAVDADQTVSGPINPYLDPKNDPYNPQRYIASNTLTGIAFAIVMAIALVQTFYTLRYGSKWMFAMTIGLYTYAIGFGCRFGLHYYPDSETIFIAEYLFIVLSPCAFIASDYVLLGRLARHVSCTAHVLLRVQKLTLIFVSSDIMTFIIQAIGGGMSVSRNLTQYRIGSHIFIAGLVIQLVSFSVFSGIYVRFLYRVYTLERKAWERNKLQPWYRDWRALSVALAISCIGILTRSCYRVAELSEGFQGYLATTEAFFYALDTFPLIVATSVYILFWPGWFIQDESSIYTPCEPKALDVTYTMAYCPS